MKKRIQSFSVKAQGDSMFPLLQDGDLIEYRHVPFHQIKINDIILVYTGEILMTHRVIYKTRFGCVTRGDNNNLADQKLQEGQVLAKAIRFKRRGAWYEIGEVYLTQSLIYMSEIQKLETLLRIHHLEHVFIKGVLISLKYLGDIPKRIYADCDVLVKRNDYDDIVKVFKLMGYRYSVISHPFVSDKHPEDKSELNFVKKVRGVQVIFDIHLEPVFLMLQLGGMHLLYPKLEQLGNFLMSRKNSSRIKGFEYSLCSPSDQILYLALHIFHHNFTDIIRYQLLDGVIRKGASKKIWIELAQTIRVFQLEGYVYLVFIFLRKYCKTPVPKVFMDEIQPTPFKKWISNFFYRRVDVFGGDSRLKAGIERLMLIILLSPEPMGKKLLLFIHPDTIRSTFTALSLKIRSLLHRNF